MQRYNKRGYPIIGFKGGGGGGSSSTSGLDPTFKPFVQRGLSDAENIYQQGRIDPRAAGAISRQAQVGGIRAAQDAVAGTGEFDRRAANERALQNLQGSQLAGASAQGNLTSARAQRAQAAAQADLAQQHQLQREQQIQGGLQALSDAPHKETQRYFGYLGSAPGLTQQTSSSKQGGGK